jgi:acyl-CoA thioesterase I
MGFKQLSGLLAAIVLALLTFAPAAADPVRIVGFGASLMAGYRLDPGNSFPERLEIALRDAGHDVVIANAGVSGDTTSGGLERLDWSVPDDTDIVLLELGANDMLRGLSPEATERNLAAMIERLSSRDIDVVLIGMLAAPNLGTDYAEAFDAIYPRLAERYELAFHPFFLDGVATESGFLLDDGMHPNPKGVDRMVEGILPLMEEVLAGAETQPDEAAMEPFRLAGTVSYRERIALPDSSTLAVRLVNIALLDAAAEVIAEAVMPAGTGGPFTYELRVDPEPTRHPMHFALEAVILHQGRMLFRETVRYETSMNDRDDIDIVLEMVGAPD